MAQLTDLQADLTALTGVVTTIGSDINAAVADIANLALLVKTLQDQIAAGTISPTDLDPIHVGLQGLLTTLGNSAKAIEGATATGTTPGPAGA